MRPAQPPLIPRGPRILVCTPERHIARMLQLNLERLKQSVVCVYEHKEAISLLEPRGAPAFDRVVLDVTMPKLDESDIPMSIRDHDRIGYFTPKLDGFDVLKWIREHAHTRHLWVAMMLSHLRNQDIYDGLPHQADAYLAKPLNPLELLR